MDHLVTLSDLQQRNSRIAALDAEATRLPKEAAAIEVALVEAKKSLDILRARQDKVRKDLRAKEKVSRRSSPPADQSETRLSEVKTEQRSTRPSSWEIRRSSRRRAGDRSRSSGSWKWASGSPSISARQSRSTRFARSKPGRGVTEVGERAGPGGD